MTVVLLALLLMNPCWSAGDFDEYAPDFQRVLELSAKDRPSAPKAFTVRASENMTIKEILSKAEKSKDATAYWEGLDRVSPAAKLLGYMSWSYSKDKPGLKRLLDDLDKGAWKDIYGKLNLNKPTANDVFLLLDEVKIKVYGAPIEQSTKIEYVSYINKGALGLIAGKWGFKKCEDKELLAKLKEAAERIGGTSADVDKIKKLEGAAQFTKKVFDAFKEKLPYTVKDPALRRHRLTAFFYMVNGYYRFAINMEEALEEFEGELEGLMASNPELLDLKGRKIGDFIKNPEKALRKK